MSSNPVIELDSTPDLEAAREYSYSVKINAAQKKAFSVRKLRLQMHFSSLEALKEQLIENFDDLITILINWNWARPWQSWKAELDNC